MVSPAFTGFFFAFAGMVLLLFASLAGPGWNKISFLTATANGTETIFGLFSECISGSCSKSTIGYNLMLGGDPSVNLNDTTLHRLTLAMILHPIAGGAALIALIFGLFGIICASRFMTILMALWSALGALAALVIFVIDMVIWNLVRNRIIDAGYTASLGYANWFTVGATVALFLSFCTATCGACGRFATGRMAGEKY